MTGGISKVGDAMVRTALYEAANVMLTRAGRFSTLKRWALGVAQRRGTSVTGRWASSPSKDYPAAEFLLPLSNRFLTVKGFTVSDRS